MSYDQELGEPDTNAARVAVILMDAVEASPGLRGLRNALRLLADELPPRTSLRQALAFLAVADASARGRAVQMKDLRLWMGEDESGRSGNSVANTFATFMDFDGGKDWITQDVEPDDRRRKTLKLTEKGRKIAADLHCHVETALNAGAPTLTMDVKR